MVDQDGRDGLMSVLSGLTQHHRMSLVHITHYNDEADAADRTVNLTGNGAPPTTPRWWRPRRRPRRRWRRVTIPTRRCSS